MNEEIYTVTVIFNDEKKRAMWLEETITRQTPQHKETAKFIANQTMAKNIDLNLKEDKVGETTEKLKDVQLQLPFGRPLNCS